MLVDEVSEFLEIVNLKNCFDVDVESGLNEFSWEEFKEMLLTHRIRNKKDGEGFMPVLMKPEAEWVYVKSKDIVNRHDGTVTEGRLHHRADINIEAITALVIDIDKPGALEPAEQVFAQHEYIVHSTHNYTPETPWKYRMIIRLAEPIYLENWGICFEALKSRLDIDTSCCNPSRFYYYPSHSSKSNIPPKAYHHKGKPITLDELLSLAVNKINSPSFKPIKYQKNPVGRVRSRRHFSGNIVSHYDSISAVDFSFTAMLDRNKAALQSYDLDGSNHRLALSVTSRELATYGPLTDLKSLILFLFKVAGEGSKPIECGNTADEMPGMILTGMAKYAPEAFEKLVVQHGDNLESWLCTLIAWASMNYKTAVMDSPPPQAEAKSTSVKEGDFYEVLRARHKTFLKDFIKSGDAAGLFRNVLTQELKSEVPKYGELARALVNYLFGYEVKVKNKLQPQAVNKISTDIPRLMRVISENKIPSSEKKLTFMRSALRIELIKRGVSINREAREP